MADLILALADGVFATASLQDLLDVAAEVGPPTAGFVK
jgi:hypothetical protein